MAVDFQVTFPQESVRLNTVLPATIGGLAAVRVLGEDFSAVDEVVINDVPSPDVILLSRTEMLAQLPDALQAAPDVRSVVVLSNTFTVSSRSLLRFRIGKSPGKVRGVMRLLQLFVKVLLTTPGTDMFKPNLGGGVLGKVGATFGANEASSLISEIVIAVTRTQRQIVAMQSKDQRSPRDERLLSASVVGSQFDKVQGALFVRIRIITQLGELAEANLEV